MTTFVKVLLVKVPWSYRHLYLICNDLLKSSNCYLIFFYLTSLILPPLLNRRVTIGKILLVPTEPSEIKMLFLVPVKTTNSY